MELFNINFVFSKKIIYETLNRNIKKRGKGYICAVDGNIAIETNKNEKYCKIINKSIINICDGSWLALAYRIINCKKVTSYTGPDFFIDIIKLRKYNSFFLGTSEDILGSLKKELIKIDNRIENMRFYAPPFLPVDEFNYEEIGEIVKKENPDIIWIALGAPKQEYFMTNLLPYINKGVMIAVGAAFTFYSGYKQYRRAPKAFRKLHMEWLFRFFLEPRKQSKRIVRGVIYLPLLFLKEAYKKKILKYL